MRLAESIRRLRRALTNANLPRYFESAGTVNLLRAGTSRDPNQKLALFRVPFRLSARSRAWGLHTPDPRAASDPYPPRDQSRARIKRCARWALFFALMPLLGCSRQPSNQLVVGMELKYPPFEMVDQQGQPTGISVDLARELGKALHREVRIENIPFDGLIPALQTARIDLIISSLTETPERARSIDFSEPYLHTGLCLLVNKAAPLESVTDADKPNISIAVKQGTTGQVYAREHLKSARVLVLDQEDACVLEVVQNKAQGFIYDQMSIFKHWQQHQDATKALLRPFQQEQWAIGLRKDQDELKKQVNSFLKDFKARGGFDRLGEKYLADQKAAFTKLHIPFYF